MPTETFSYCPTCARQQPVEAPPCTDGHGPECPERVCTVCAGALLVAPAPLEAVTVRVATDRAA